MFMIMLQKLCSRCQSAAIYFISTVYGKDKRRSELEENFIFHFPQTWTHLFFFFLVLHPIFSCTIPQFWQNYSSQSWIWTTQSTWLPLVSSLPHLFCCSLPFDLCRGFLSHSASMLLPSCKARFSRIEQNWIFLFSRSNPSWKVRLHMFHESAQVEHIRFLAILLVLSYFYSRLLF